MAKIRARASLRVQTGTQSSKGRRRGWSRCALKQTNSLLDALFLFTPSTQTLTPAQTQPMPLASAAALFEGATFRVPVYNARSTCPIRRSCERDDTISVRLGGHIKRTASETRRWVWPRGGRQEPRWPLLLSCSSAHPSRSHGPSPDLALRRPACLASPSINSVASRCASCTDSRPSPCHEWPTRAGKPFLRRILTVVTARFDGVDSGGPRHAASLRGQNFAKAVRARRMGRSRRMASRGQLAS